MRAWPAFWGAKPYAVIDAGSHKLACAIVKAGSPTARARGEAPEVLGFAVMKSNGFQRGKVVDMAAAEHCLRSLVAKTEKLAGLQVEDVFITSQFEGLKAETLNASLALERWCVSAEEAATLREAVISHASNSGAAVLQVSLIDYILDGQVVADSPIGLGGNRLEASLLSLTAELDGISRLEHCLRRAMLCGAGFIPAPAAAALAVTTEEERELGITVVDMGACATNCAVFENGRLHFAHAVPEGGLKITAGISRQFAIPLAEAEKLKIRYGSVFERVGGNTCLPGIQTSTGESLPLAALNDVIRARFQAVLRAVNDRLKAFAYFKSLEGGVVLTGGASLIPGALDVASQIFGARTRAGKPRSLGPYEMDERYTALAGACHWVWQHLAAEREPGVAQRALKSSYAARISEWVRASF